MNINPERALVGLATIFGVRCPNDGRTWQAGQFQRFLDLETAVPLRLNHGPLITSSGVIGYIGVARYFAAVTEPTSGLLVLGEIDEANGFGDRLLSDLAAETSMTYLPPSWGLSIGAHVAEDEDLVWPYELSLVHNPAFEDARILRVGGDAIKVWELLTECAPARSGDS